MISGDRSSAAPDGGSKELPMREAREAHATAAESYASNGYAMLKGLFPPIVTQVFHTRLQNDLNLTETRRFVSHSDLLSKPAIEVYSPQYQPMAAFLWGLTPAISRIAGCELLPTYAYFRVYQRGDICRVHSDRHACEHSLSLMLELADNLPWSLSIGRERFDSQVTTVEEDFGTEDYVTLPMGAGDAVLYRGVNHRHGRIEPNPNRWSAHLFLHWVDSSGPHADHAFDQIALAHAQLRTS